MGTKTPPESIGSRPACAICGSERVARDAWACFNPQSGLWELEHMFDQAHCHNCSTQTTLIWDAPDQPPHLRIRELNDRFRQQGEGRGTVMVTSGLQALGPDALLEVITAVRAFEGFDGENDPWGEHDFGALDVAGEKVFFKFGYFADETLSAGSENPANEGLCYRVLTLMCAREY